MAIHYDDDLGDAAYRAGLAGKPMPEELAGDDRWEGRYFDGRREREADPEFGHQPRKKPSPAATARAPKAPAAGAKTGARSRPARSSTRRSTSSKKRPASKTTRAVRRYGFGGSPGGLVLAVIVYPVVLNTLLHGWKDGGRAWLSAKFVNNNPLTGSGGIGIGIGGYGVGTNGQGGIKITIPGGSVSAGGTLPAEPGWQNVPAPSFSTPGGK